MYSHESALTSLFNLWNNLNSLLQQYSSQQEESINKGLALYNLGEFTDAKSYLTIGAVAGDRASQYALGEVIRRQAMTVTEEAKKWYRLAGAQDHVYALMRLGDKDSLEKAQQLAQAKADEGDADAMLELYELDQNIETLKKAAHAGSLEGQYILAVKYDQDPTLIVDSTKRQAVIDLLLKSAAAAGLPKAMEWYTNRPSIRRNPDVKLQWLIKRVALGDINGLLDYGYALSGVYSDDDGVDTEYGTTLDLINGYGLVWLVIQATRELRRHLEARENLAIIAKEMTADQITAAQAFAEEWKQSHPAMSEFRLTYSEVR